jgi:hypothetical protein
LKEEALDRTLWRTRFGRGYGPVVRQTAKWMNELERYHVCCSDIADCILNVRTPLFFFLPFSTCLFLSFKFRVKSWTLWKS